MFGAARLNSLSLSASGPAAAFAVPTAAFTNDANTKLLLHFNGTNGATTTTDDDGGARTAKSITVVGNAQVSTAQAKFGSASCLMDGTGDGLFIDSSEFLFSGAYTYEWWVYKSATPTDLKALGGQGAQFSNNQAFLFMNTSNQIIVYLGGTLRITSTATIANNTWTHVALTKDSSGVHRLFIGGTLQATTFTDATAVGGSSGFHFGREPSASTRSWNGYLDEFRVSNTARYTATFTPSASAFTNDANTVLLLHMEGANASTTFSDDNGAGRTAKTMTMISSATLSTTQAKFGASSLYVDGTGADYVSTPDSDDWDLQAAPRTFECWCYINSFTNISRNSPNHLTKLMGHMDQAGNSYWTFGPNTDQGMSFYYWSGSNNWVHSTAKDLVTGRWYHMALIVTATGAKVYVDGVEYLSSPLTNTPTKGNTIFSIGADFGQCMNAYIDEVRVSHVNRYT